MEQARTRTVLLVEADQFLRRLITIGLQHLDMRVIEANSPENVTNIEEQQIDLIVLDVDRGVTTDWSCVDALCDHLDLSILPTIILGWDCQSPLGAPLIHDLANLAHVACLDKPFDARILHRKIEQLLADRAYEEEQEEAAQEAVLLASYEHQSAPSAYPIVTAIGLVIIAIGMMLQVVIVAVGLIIVVGALLLWTLNAKGHTSSVAIS
jgi:CheY-like chemotaxis protein